MEYVNTLCVPAGLDNAKKFSIQASNNIFHFAEGREKGGEKSPFPLYSYVTELLFGCTFTSSSPHLPFLVLMGLSTPASWLVLGRERDYVGQVYRQTHTQGLPQEK